MYAIKDQLVLVAEKEATSNYFPTQTIVYLYLAVMAIKYVHDVPKSVYTINHTNQVYENIIYVQMTLIMIIALNKLNIEAKLS